jgi:L-asparaginase II
MNAGPNPIVAELWRGDGVESVHRGAWVLVDTAGAVIDGSGDPDQLVYPRSSTKSIQALALVETAADALGVSDAEIAVAISSHNGETIHADAARSLLARAGNTESDLQCGPQRPAGAGNDVDPERILNNCSGKHAGMLAAASRLGDDAAAYLDPASAVQGRIAEAIMAMTGADPARVSTAIDGCSAPTYRLPLAALATGLARMANPADLPDTRATACARITRAAAAHPELVAGTAVPRFDTDVIAASEGTIFAKSGAEGVQTIGVVGGGVGFAAKIDDGNPRSVHRLALAVLDAHGHLPAEVAAALGPWHDEVRRNRDGIDIGRHVVHLHGPIGATSG